MKPIFGLVLSGGKSSRMGRDKGALRYRGVSQITCLYMWLSRLCSEVFVSIRDTQRSSEVYQNFPVILDGDDIGPMGGLAEAFRAHSDVAWLLVAVDLPHVTEKTLAALVAARESERHASRIPPVAFAFLNPEIDGPDPMCAIYEPEMMPLIRERIAEGRYGLRRLLEQSAICALPPVDAHQFHNVNTPAEYAATIDMMKNNKVILGEYV